jgi:predicted CoA-binding protein
LDVATIFVYIHKPKTMKKDKTLVIGASLNPERYACKAALKLLEHGHEIYLLGSRPGILSGREIVTEPLPYPDVDTVTLYLSPKNQEAYREYIISLRPRRVIFNPGAENPALASVLLQQGIQPLEACTLVLLSTRAY